MLRPASGKKSYHLMMGNTRAIRVIFAILCNFYTKEYLTHITDLYRRSKVSVESLMADFMKFNVPAPPTPVTDIWTSSCKIAIELFLPGFKWRPVHFADTRYYPWNLSTSAEYPFTRDTGLKESIQAAFEEGLLPTNKVNKQNAFNYAYV